MSQGRFGVFRQVNDDVGIVICGPEDTPPVVLMNPLAPPGWALLEDVIDVETKEDGLLEVYIYVRDEAANG